MKKTLTIVFNIVLNIILMPLRLVWSLTWVRYRQPIIDDLKQAQTHEIAFVLTVLIGVLFAVANMGVKADMIYIGFDVPPPSEYNWTLHRHVLAGDYNEYQYHWTDYAWNTYKDKEFMYMLATENGLFNHDKRSNVYKDILLFNNDGTPLLNADGTQAFKRVYEDSWGFCQIHRYYHSDKVNDPRFLTDPQWQMDTCYELFTGGTVFYGYKRYMKGGKYADTIRAKFNF